MMIPILQFTLLVLGAVAVADARNIQSDKEPRLLFFVHGDRLWQLEVPESSTPSSRQPHLQLTVNNYVADYEVDESEDRLYWLDRAAQVFSRTGLKAAATSDRFAFQYEEREAGTPRIARDYVTGNLYAVNGRAPGVDVFDETGKNWTVLLDRHRVIGSSASRMDQEYARRVVLDPNEGLMFLLANHNGMKNIYRSKMDGTEPQLVISNSGSDELAIDCINKRIYWVNRKVIESANYAGGDRKYVLKIQNAGALSVSDNELYWSTNESDSTEMYIYKCDLRAEDWSCAEGSIQRLVQLSGRTGDSRQLVRSMRVFRTGSGDKQIRRNPCAGPDNGDCAHLCLLASPTTRSCACSRGWEPVDPEAKQCRPSVVLHHLLQLLDTRGGSRYKRQNGWDMYTQQPTLRPDPQQPQEPAHIPIYIFYPGK